MPPNWATKTERIFSHTDLSKLVFGQMITLFFHFENERVNTLNLAGDAQQNQNKISNNFATIQTIFTLRRIYRFEIGILHKILFSLSRHLRF